VKLLVNASNLVIGGGIQVGVWFIRECMSRNVDAYFAISPQIQQELNLLEVDTNSSQFHLISNSPSRNKLARGQLRDLASSLSVDRVFTVFGPSYVKFDQPHLCGFADGWVSHSRWQNFKRAIASDVKSGISLLLTCFYKALAIRNANEWVFETQVAAQGLSRRAGLPINHCHVVANNCSSAFFQTDIKPAPEGQVFKALYLTADYPHKGIDNFLHYAQALQHKAPDKKITFTISISAESATAKWILTQAEQLGLSHYFDFCGHIPVADVVGKIDDSHLIMQMSHLETFSANYPEAMARQRPLLVSDYPFARDICKNAAVFVNPDNANEVAESILKIQSDDVLRESLIQHGTQVLAELPSLSERFDKYIKIITTMKSGM
jgi:glycosyltransferase involved in cell wall biosynthesis